MNTFLGNTGATTSNLNDGKSDNSGLADSISKTLESFSMMHLFCILLNLKYSRDSFAYFARKHRKH